MTTGGAPLISAAEARSAVIAFLTLALEAAGAGEIPADMRASLGAALEPHASTVALTGSRDPMPPADATRLLQQVADDTQDRVSGHFGMLLGAMAGLFAQLAIEAAPALDAREFLRRQALAPPGGDQDDAG